MDRKAKRNTMRVFDMTGAALLQPKPEPRHWNPFWYLWMGWQHFAYFFAPPDQCVYCWVLRLFIIGAALGAGGMWWYLKR